MKLRGIEDNFEDLSTWRFVIFLISIILWAVWLVTGIMTFIFWDLESLSAYIRFTILCVLLTFIPYLKIDRQDKQTNKEMK